MSQSKSKNIRLDKWLWAARFFKTRSLAVKAIQQGKVRYDGQKATPSRAVQVGAHLTIENPLYQQAIIVQELAEKRQSATVAQSWYEETAESLERKQVALEKRRAQRLMALSAPVPDSKPMKHARKKLRSLKRRNDS